MYYSPICDIKKEKQITFILFYKLISLQRKIKSRLDGKVNDCFTMFLKY